MSIRRVAILAAFGALAAWGQALSPTVLGSSAGCTPPSATVACSTIGAAYTTGLTVTSPPIGAGTAVWSFAAGTQPPGLGISSTGMDTGKISGSPTQPGFYTFTVAATYGTMPATVVTAQYSIAIAGPKLTIVAPLSLPNGTAGVAFTTTVFTASGGVPFIDSMGSAFYHWSIVTGPNVQSDGLVIDQNSGTLTGTPTNAGIFQIEIGAIDAVGATAIHIYTLNISGSNSLTITTTSLPGGIVNAAYSQKLTETGGPVPGVTWSILSGNLPTGLNISSNTDSTGTIAGTPTAAGVFNFTVQASYQVMNLGSVVIVTGTAALSITISTQLTMANPTAVSGFVNQTVTMQFTAANGTPPYTYALKTGTLPPGTSLNAQTGAVAGQATAAGASTFTIEVTDAAKQTADAQGTITITTLSLTPVTLSLTIGTGTVALSETAPPAVPASAQPPLTLSVGSPPGTALSGTLVLTFASTAAANTGADNPEVRLSDSTRMAAFTMKADGTVTLPAGLAIMTGTVAGKGTIVANFLDPLNLTGTPLASTTVAFTVASAVPVITSFTIACNPAVGTTPAFYTASIVGYSTTLDMASVTFGFSAATGVTLTNPSLTVPLPSTGTCSASGSCTSLPAWWSSSGAAKTGSQFELMVPLNFTVTGGASTNPIVAATVAAANSVNSSAVSAAANPNPACP